MFQDACRTLRSRLMPPVFPGDEDRTRRARVLNTMLVVMLALAAFSLLVGVPFFFEKKAASTATSLVALAAVATGYGIMHRGHILAAGAVAIAGLWVHFILVVVLGSGMRDANLVHFVVLPAIAGLILGRRAAIWMIAFSILNILILAVLETLRILPLSYFTQPPLARWITVAFALVLLAATLNASFKTQDSLLLSVRTQLRERERAEEELRRRGEQLAAITANIPGVVYRFYARPDGRKGFSFVSNRAGELFGLPEDAGDFFRGLLAGVHPDDHGRFVHSVDEAVAAFRRWDFEGRFVKPSGDMIWFRGQAVPSRQGEEVVFNGILLDVTAHRDAEEALRRSEQRYGSILEEIEEGYVEFDVGGHITFCNESFRRAMGYGNEELVGTSYKRYTADETEKDVIFRAYSEMFRTGEPIRRYELNLRSKEGKRRIVEHSASVLRNAEGLPMGFRGVFRDITERKEAEEQYRVMANNSQAGEFIAIEGRFLFVNRHILQYSGYAEEELIGSSTLHFVHPEDRNMVREMAWQMRKGLLPSPYEYRIRTKNGEVRWLLESVTMITYRGRRAVLGNNMDITETREARQKLESMQQQLLQAQKLESLGTLAGGIAHDFNNLLMGIQGYASLMLLGLEAGHPHYEKLRAIESQVQSGSDLTRQLLGFAQGGRFEVRPTDMNDLVRKTTGMFGRTKKEIRIFEKYAESPWSVEADRGQLEQVLLNLLVNAWQAMPGGGDLYLETSNAEVGDQEARAYGIGAGSYVKVTVTDTGTGMDERTRQRIFDPFFTTKEMGRGTGLGLASAYGILKGHGGTITVSSEPGRGTTFEVYLPASELEAAPEASPPGGIEPGRGMILVVDDEPLVREVTREMLLGLGYEVLTAVSGPEALEIYGSRGEEIDAVILDMIMPGMGGGEVYDRLRSENRDVRVILSSGYSLDGQAAEILERGVLGFLQKPFRLEDLSRKIREALEA